MTVRLFEPIQIDKLKLSNRIVIAPMCQYSATSEGVMTDWHTIHLGHLALSGAGLLIIEATGVEAVGRISPRDSGLYSDACERGLARVLEAVRANSAMPIAIQLAHAGRKASHKVPWEGSAQIRSTQSGGWRTLCAVGGAVHAGRRSAAGARSRRARPRQGRVQAGRAALGAARARRHRDPQRARLSPARIPVAARRTSATINTAARCRIACASRSKYSTRCAR